MLSSVFVLFGICVQRRFDLRVLWSKMSGRQQTVRLFIQERLTAAAVEIFAVLEKTISEYEEQVVQSKREVDQLKQDLRVRHLNTVKPHILPSVKSVYSQTVSEELLPLQHVNPRQELMSSQEDEAAQHQSPQVKEEQMDLCYIPDSETSSSGTNPFVESQTTSDSQLIPSHSYETVQQRPQVKEEQVDLSIIPDSETSIYNIVTKGFVTSESTSDSQLIPCHTTETAIANHDAANNFNESEGSGLTFSQSEYDTFSMEQKICHYCRKQFHSFSDLIKHVEESHKGHKAFKCSKCDREFARRDQWTVHNRIHTGVKPHSCPVCGKMFTQRSNFNVHMRTHTGVKPHSCPVCGKLFTHSSTVKVHMAIHTGVRPHSCPVCEKSFTRRSYLNSHMRLHTGDETYFLQQMWQYRCPQI